MPYGKGREQPAGAKGELIRELESKRLENWPFDYPFDGVYPELAAALSVAEGVAERAQDEGGMGKCFDE